MGTLHFFQTSKMTTLFAFLLVLPSLAFALNCTTKANGNYEIGCRSYAVCSNGQTSIHDCPDDQVYNNATAQCDDPANVAQPCGLIRDCTNQKDGSYADRETGCGSYYTCYSSTYFGHNFCTGGTVFDAEKQVCNWKNQVVPPCGTKVTV